MRKVKISKVKNIESLEFDIPSPGVYLLTGANGAGKTTLLAALHRIGYRNAFADFFKTTPHEKKLDFFGESSISYETPTKKVTYNYGNTRWAPTPKSNSKLLQEFGFPDVKFIAADSKRIEATQDELKTTSIKPAEKHIIDDIVKILGSTKYNDLKFVNTKRGGGNRAYLLAKKHKGKNLYFSEKNFSLGELCILRLVTILSNISYQSLVLIDEIEMALHPKAQAALFNYLHRVADDKNLTVIFSTHSASLIKRAKKNKILLLKDSGEGQITCKKNVYPAQALGDIAYDDEINPDFLFFVEDYKAKTLLEQMIFEYKTTTSNQIPPYFKVIPVGGFKETIEFLINSDQIFSDSVKRYAFLDKDVETESIKEAEANQKYKFLQKVKENRGKIKYLPCTPEQGLMEMIHQDELRHCENINNLFDDHIIDTSRIIDSNEYISINLDNPRRKAKKQFEHLTNEITKRTGLSPEYCEKKFALYYVSQTYQNKRELGAIFGPIFQGQ